MDSLSTFALIASVRRRVEISTVRIPRLMIALFPLASLLWGAGSAVAQTNYQWQVTTSGGLWNVAGNWSPSGPANGSLNSADFSALTLPANDTVHLNASETIGSLIFGDRANTFNWTIDNNGSSGNLLTLAGSAAVTVNNDTATISALLAGSSGLTVNSLPLVALNFGQLYNLGSPGNFPANSSNVATAGTLVLNPTAVESYSGPTALNSGVLSLDFSNLPTPTNMIGSGSALVMVNGVLSIKDQAGASATSQTFNGTTFNAGTSVISVSLNGNTNSASTLALGALTRNTAATTSFTLPAIGSITTTTANAYGSGSSAILGGWATVTTQNNVTWAVSAGDGVNPGAISALPQSAYGANTFSSGANTSVTPSTTFGADASINSLYFNTPSGVINPTTNSGNPASLTINSGGILVTPNVGPTSTGVNPPNGNGTFMLVTSANPQGELIVNQTAPNGAFFLEGNLQNNGAAPVGLTKTGPGTLVLIGGNSSGTTYINQGIVAFYTNYTGSGTQIVFTGNSTYQMFSPAGGAFPPANYPGNLVKTVNAGVTATFDNITSLSNATALLEGDGYFTGPGSIAISSSFGQTNGAFFIISSLVNPNSYGGSTTIFGTEVTARYGAPGGNINRFNPNAPFYMGGVLQLQPYTTGAAMTNPGVTVQTLGSNWNLMADTASTLTTITIAPAVAGTTFNLSSPTGGMTRGAGATTTFAPFTSDNVTTLHVGGPTNSTPGMIGGWATYGVNAANAVTLTISDWAALNSSNNIVSLTAAGGSYATNTWSPGSNTDVTSSSLSASGATNSLRFNTTNACTVTLASGSRIASGGILVSSNVTSQANVITGGSITSGAQDLVVNQFDTTAGGSLEIASQIAGPIGLTVTGNTQGATGSGGLVILSNGTNNYTGPTVINAAVTLKLNAAGVIPNTSAVVLSERATLNLNGFSQSIGSLAAVSYGTTVNGGSGAMLTVGNDNTNTTFNGVLSNLALVKVGSGTLTLGTFMSYSFGQITYLGSSFYGVGSAYSGGTTIDDGTISVELDGALGSATGGLIVNGTAVAPAALQATATFTSARTIQLGPTSGSGLGTFDVVGPYTLTLSGAIGNQSGGSGGLVKTDGGTLVLTNAGSTYSGGTIITGGILNISADHALGNPTSGNNITFNGSFGSGGGTLQFASAYTGSTDTSLATSRNITVSPGDSGTIDTNGNNITWGGLLTVGNGSTLTKIGVGSFAIQAVPALNNNSALAVSTGTLRFNVTSGGPATIGTGATATVGAGATLELAGSVPALGTTAGIPTGNLVNVVNNSQAATTGGLHVTGTNQLAGAIIGTGNMVVESGAGLTAYQIRQNSLTINGTGKVALIPSGSGSTTNPAAPNNINFSSNVGSLSIAGAPNAWTGTLDIGNNGLVIQYGANSDPFTTITNMVKSGYNNGDWTGTGITSSLARAAAVLGSPIPALNIGLVDFVPNTGTFGSSIVFEGQTVTTNAVLVRLTYMDDLVLAGDMAQANATSDALFFAANYGSGTIWHVGDITHDGVIDTNDALLFAANYVVGLPSLDGTTGNAMAIAAGSAAIPEPASMVLAAFGAFGIGIILKLRGSPPE